MEPKKSVLFLCTRNSCRSQMAEGWLRHLAEDRFEVFSAGMEPTRVHPLAAKVMAEAGVDISGQRSKSVKEVLGRHAFAHIFIVCEQANEQCPSIYPTFMDNFVFWPFDDPEAVEGSEEEKLEKFREVRDLIRDRIASWLERMG